MPMLPTLDSILLARATISGSAIRTPLVRLYAEDVSGGGNLANADSRRIYLKLENLQPIGSFKIRGATNAMCNIPADILRRGVLTASAGNMAQGVAWRARDLGIKCTVIAPDHAPLAK